MRVTERERGGRSWRGRGRGRERAATAAGEGRGREKEGAVGRWRGKSEGEQEKFDFFGEVKPSSAGRWRRFAKQKARGERSSSRERKGATPTCVQRQKAEDSGSDEDLQSQDLSAAAGGINL